MRIWKLANIRLIFLTVRVSIINPLFFLDQYLCPFLLLLLVPQNPDNFRPSTQDETSVTLQWDKISSSVSFVLQFNGTETNISTPSGYGPVTHTVSSLSARTKYTFSLFSVFENLRSSGVSITAATGRNICFIKARILNGSVKCFLVLTIIFSFFSGYKLMYLQGQVSKSSSKAY